MRLTVFTALALALVGGLLPGCNKTATDTQERSARGAERSSGGSSGQSPGGAATGQASEGSTDDRKAPARPSSR